MLPLLITDRTDPEGKVEPVSNAGVAVDVEPTTTPELMVTVATSGVT
jgi:hypothetical protein